MFSTDQELLDFAAKFLDERLSSLNKDVKVCIRETLPFPALLYCFSTIDLLGSLYEGDATGNTRKYGKSVGTTGKAQRYMIEIMKYPEYESKLLQDQFRHKIVHLAQPQAVISDDKNSRRIGWILYNRYEGKHMIVEKLPASEAIVTLTPGTIFADHLFAVSIEKLVQDIDESVNSTSDGYLKKLSTESKLRSKFDTAIGHIYS